MPNQPAGFATIRLCLVRDQTVAVYYHAICRLDWMKSFAQTRKSELRNQRGTPDRGDSEVFRPKPSPFDDSRQHPQSDLLLIMERAIFLAI